MLCESLILGVHLASAHLQPAINQHNANPGIYAECDGLTAGAYRNTLGRASVYAGYTLHSGPFAVSLGAVSGYQKRYAPGECRPGYREDAANPCLKLYGITASRLMPMIAPSVSLGPARLWYLPRVGAHSSVLHLSLQHQF